MPTMDGPSTLKALRDIPQLAMIPIIFMTAKIQTQEDKYYKELNPSIVLVDSPAIK